MSITTSGGFGGINARLGMVEKSITNSRIQIIPFQGIRVVDLDGLEWGIPLHADLSLEVGLYPTIVRPSRNHRQISGPSVIRESLSMQ